MFTEKIPDSTGREITVEVSEDVFNIFEDEKRELKRESSEYGRHGDDRDPEDRIVARKAAEASEPLEDLFFRQETLRAVRNLLGTCTPLQRERFTLYAEGYSFAEIARIQHCAVMTVKKSVITVRKKIKKFVEPGLKSPDFRGI